MFSTSRAEVLTPASSSNPEFLKLEFPLQMPQTSNSQVQPPTSGDFGGLGLETGASEIPQDLGGQHAHGLHYSESELNLAGMVRYSS